MRRRLTRPSKNSRKRVIPKQSRPKPRPIKAKKKVVGKVGVRQGAVRKRMTGGAKPKTGLARTGNERLMKNYRPKPKPKVSAGGRGRRRKTKVRSSR